MDKAYLKAFLNKELSLNADSILDKFSKYEELLLSYNQKFNLTAITDEEGILEKHFIDSLMAMKFIDFKNKSLCDIGTGAGFPGMVLAIANPTLKVALVESNNKKVSFLKVVKNELGLNNVTVISSRAEDLKGYREHFDYVSARAVTRLNVLLELGVPLLKVNGHLLAYKLADNENEILEAKNALKVLSSSIENNYKFNLPISNAERSLIVIKKHEVTKAKYPRSYSLISKKGL